jgi:hypothetical protein
LVKPVVAEVLQESVKGQPAVADRARRESSLPHSLSKPQQVLSVDLIQELFLAGRSEGVEHQTVAFECFLPPLPQLQIIVEVGVRVLDLQSVWPGLWQFDASGNGVKLRLLLMLKLHGVAPRVGLLPFLLGAFTPGNVPAAFAVGDSEALSLDGVEELPDTV